MEPDLLCLAKGLGGGFPMGAFAYTAAVHAALSPGALRHGYVWTLLSFPLLQDNILQLIMVGLGLFFEDLPVGRTFRTIGRTVTEADNVAFTTMTMNTQALHLDAAYSEGTEFGERLVNSMFTLSTLVGLSVARVRRPVTDPPSVPRAVAEASRLATIV